MIENEKVREEVKDKMKTMIGTGTEKIKGMAILKKQYNIPGAELSELWIDCKVELGKDKKENNEIKNNTLEIIDQVKVIKGQFGYYHKSKDGIRYSNGEKLINDDVAYASKEELIINKDKLTKEYLDRVKTLNRQIEELNNELNLSNKSYETMNEHFKEIEQVFDM